VSDPFDFLRTDRRYNDRRGRNAKPLDRDQVKSIILHDRGGSYPGHSPYHLEVLPDGRIMNHWDSDQRAPHAAGMNPHAYGVSYGGQVGSTPTKEAMESLDHIIGNLLKQNPGLKVESHGQAYARTKGTPLQASKDGRGLEEASWRHNLGGATSPQPDKPGLFGSAKVDWSTPAPLPRTPTTADLQGRSIMAQRGQSAPVAEPQQGPTTLALQPFAPRPEFGGPGQMSFNGAGEHVVASPTTMPSIPNQPHMPSGQAWNPLPGAAQSFDPPKPSYEAFKPSPAYGARSASELQNGTDGMQPAKPKSSGPVGAQWGFDGADHKITWADGSTNTLGQGRGGNQPAERKPAMKWGGTPSAGGSRQSGPASMPMPTQAPKAAAQPSAPDATTPARPNILNAFNPPTAPHYDKPENPPSQYQPTAPHYDAPGDLLGANRTAPAFDEPTQPPQTSQAGPLAAQPVAYQPGRTKPGTAPIRGDKNEQGFDPALMTDLAADKSRKMYFDPKQFPGSMDYLKTDAVKPLTQSAPSGPASWNPFKSLFGS
jgi:N-acetylmuramoyl-L-alanine amidase